MTEEKTEHNDSARKPTDTDETLQKLTEEALRESEARYRDLVENALDLICIHDSEGVILLVSSAAAKAIGFKPEDIMGLRVPDLLPEDRRHEFYDYVENIQRDGSAAGIMKVMSPGGKKLYWEYRSSLRTEGVDKPVIRSIARDVSNEVLAKRELKKSEKRYRLLFERNLAGVYRTTLNGRFLDCNDAFARIYGYSSREEVMKLAVADLYINPKARDEFIAALQAKGTIQNLESRRIRKDGSMIWLLENASLVPDKDGNLTEIEGTLIDITGRKKADEELLKADKLESVGILAGGIAHDFNNILTSILGNISLARMQVEPGSKIFDLLSAAEASSIKARELTGRLLTFARGGAPAKRIVSILNLIQESSLYMLKGSKSKGELSIPGDLWPVEADPVQISQVINNIIINADQAMPDGGVVLVEAANLVLEEGDEIQVKPGRYIRISIKDNGIGIDEKHLSKIFDPYFSTKQTGSGLGLATTYSIIKKHNGHISVNSSLGIGTTFSIYLPASDQNVPETEESLVNGQGKILMMDDDRMLREMAGAMLEILGYEAEFAINGEEAIEMYRKAMKSENPYDAVILDLNVPGGMGGKDAIKRLLELDCKLRAIVCSGYSDDPIMSNYREYGFKVVMPKPFDFKALSKALNEVLKNERRET